MSCYFLFFILILLFINPLYYFPEIPHGGFLRDVVIATLELNILDNILQLHCNARTLKG